MLAARAFVGVGEASYATLAPVLIDDVAPVESKSRWMAIFYSATPIGSALGYLVGGAVLHAHGWHTAFFVAGGPGLAVALLCLLIAEPPRPARHAVAQGLLGSAKALVRVPLYRNIVLGYCAYTFALGGLAYWAPTYLNVRYDIDPGHASVVFGLITVAAGSIGTLAGGWIADRATRAATRRAEAAKGAPLTTEEMNAAIARGNVSVPALGATIGAPLTAAAIAAGTAPAFFRALFPARLPSF